MPRATDVPAIRRARQAQMQVRGCEREVQLRDGTRVRMRPIRPDDEPRLAALYEHLSQDSRYHRFFSVMRRLPPDWAHFLANVDYVRRFALVVEAPGEPETLIAVARYEPTSDTGCAEVAFAVQDAWQNRGLGTILFRALLEAAGANGIKRFCACVLADNRRMLDLIVRFGDVQQRSLGQGVVELTFTARHG
jgi:RimJ/RimL family protein N-acetyltransferase